MKLNHECVRELLLYLENTLDNRNPIDVLKIALEGYTKEDVEYTAMKLIEAQFINGKAKYASNAIYYFPISSITYSGHNFLDNIRPKETWEIVSDKAKTLGSVSIEIVSNIAASVVTSLLSKAIGL